MITPVFIFLRKIIFPFNKLLKYIPTQSTVLDVGCGHGTLVFEIAAHRNPAKVVGIDPDKRKITTAKSKIQGRKNLFFLVGKVENHKDGNYDVITILDVLYLLPEKDKIAVLQECRKRLRPNGVVLLKEVPINASIFSSFLKLEEFLMTKVFKLTQTQEGVYLSTVKDYKVAIERAGLKFQKKVSLKGLLPYNHVLFIATPN